MYEQNQLNNRALNTLEPSNQMQVEEIKIQTKIENIDNEEIEEYSEPVKFESKPRLMMAESLRTTQTTVQSEDDSSKHGKMALEVPEKEAPVLNRDEVKPSPENYILPRNHT